MRGRAAGPRVRQQAVAGIPVGRLRTGGHAAGVGVRPGDSLRLLDVARAVYSEQAWVVSVEEMEREGWFGGSLRPEVRTRVGEVAIIPHEPIAYLDPADGGEARLVCRHGSLTAEEMLVPFLAG